MDKQVTRTLYRVGDYSAKGILRALSTDRFYRLFARAIAEPNPEARTIVLETLAGSQEDMRTAV